MVKELIRLLLLWSKNYLMRTLLWWFFWHSQNLILKNWSDEDISQCFNYSFFCIRSFKREELVCNRDNIVLLSSFNHVESYHVCGTWLVREWFKPIRINWVLIVVLIANIGFLPSNEKDFRTWSLSINNQIMKCIILFMGIVTD